MPHQSNGIRTIASRNKIAPRLGLGFGSRFELVLELEGNQAIAPEENCPPVRVRVRVSFGVGIVLESKATSKAMFQRKVVPKK